MYPSLPLPPHTPAPLFGAPLALQLFFQYIQINVQTTSTYTFILPIYHTIGGGLLHVHVEAIHLTEFMSLV